MGKKVLIEIWLKISTQTNDESAGKTTFKQQRLMAGWTM
jgi:hypothetical protein